MVAKSPTLAELAAMPVTLSFAATCEILGISTAQGYKLAAERRFPVAPQPHSGGKRLYALADVARYLGFDLAALAAAAAGPAAAA